MKRLVLIALTLAYTLAAYSAAFAKDDGWIALPGDNSLEAWEGDNSGWTVAGGVKLDPADPRAMVAEPGEGALISTLQGHTEFRNLASRRPSRAFPKRTARPPSWPRPNASACATGRRARSRST